MTYEYQIEKQDFIDFNLNHMKTSATIKRSLFIQRFIVPIIFLIFPLVIVNDSDIPLLEWYGVFGLIFVLWIAFYPIQVKKLMEKRILKLLNEGTTNGILGKHIFQIDQESIIEITENGESRSSKIQRIEETDKHIFIYISSLAAYIIPKRIFANSEEKNNFLNALDWFKGEH